MGMKQAIIKKRKKKCSSWLEGFSPACSEFWEVNLLCQPGPRLFVSAQRKPNSCYSFKFECDDDIVSQKAEVKPYHD